QGDVALDEPGLLQRAHPPQAGGFGEAHPAGELHVADATVALQFSENLFVEAVEGHDGTLCRMPYCWQKMPQVRANVTEPASRLRSRGSILHDWIAFGESPQTLEIANMRIGVPKEIKVLEYRVGMVPAGVAELVHDGHEVFVETEAGAGIGLTDADYEAAGATVLGTAKEVFDRADLIVKVKEPQLSECAMLRPDQVLFTYLHLAADRKQ